MKVYDLTKSGGWGRNLNPNEVGAFVNTVDVWPGDVLRVDVQGNPGTVHMTGTGEVVVKDENGVEQGQATPHNLQRTPPKAGWGWPLNSRKAHVFIGCRSLCGKWMFFGSTEHGAERVIVEVFENAHRTSRTSSGPDDCATCFKKAVAHFPRAK